MCSYVFDTDGETGRQALIDIGSKGAGYANLFIYVFFTLLQNSHLPVRKLRHKYYPIALSLTCIAEESQITSPGKIYGKMYLCLVLISF